MKTAKQPDLPKPPPHLRKPGCELWQLIHSRFILHPDQFPILQLACEASDRLSDARQTIDKDGTHFRDRHGSLRPHPACAVERDSRIAVARFLKQLNLDAPPASKH